MKENFEEETMTFVETKEVVNKKKFAKLSLLSFAKGVGVVVLELGLLGLIDALTGDPLHPVPFILAGALPGPLMGSLFVSLQREKNLERSTVIDGYIKADVKDIGYVVFPNEKNLEKATKVVTEIVEEKYIKADVKDSGMEL